MNAVMERVERTNATGVGNTNTYMKYDIWMAQMREGKGSEQLGERPVLILQNNIGNKHAPTVIAAPITSSGSKNRLPTHVVVQASRGGLPTNSTILMEQIVTLDKSRLKYKICTLSERTIRSVDMALLVSFGIPMSRMAH